MTAAYRRQAGGILLTWDFRRGSPTAPRPCRHGSARTAHNLTGPEWFSGTYEQGYGRLHRTKYNTPKASFSWYSRKTLACNKACLGGPGIVPVTTAKAARLWLDAGEGAWLSGRARSFRCGCKLYMK
jgi:hypothetical protein